ncbi:hypothetical protein [Sphingomonas sp.]|uniref:hypothetical protein n=1 Tax=Sphingomonas sp. TaxID=28214 RepID=UPI001797F025|nr:hypothetical protein [Sphingomonas sp.]MBA3512520.1 hypothetical protein [Sphingomonas sp.]
MTALTIILICVAFVLIAGTFRRRPGVAVADTALLVILLGLIGIADLVLGRFVDTGGIAWTLAALLAIGFAIDALYGLMAPERQRRRDRRLAELMRGKRA